jgi:hypothetical protein
MDTDCPVAQTAAADSAEADSAEASTAGFWQSIKRAIAGALGALLPGPLGPIVAAVASSGEPVEEGSEDLENHLRGLKAIATGKATIGGNSGQLEKAMNTRRLDSDNIDLGTDECVTLVEMLSGRDADFWDAFHGRDFDTDPRVENPHPDDDSAPPSDDDEVCNGQDPFATAHCQSAQMCDIGYELDPDTCACERMSQGSIDLMCMDMTCEDGSVPTPLGPGMCQCMEDTLFADPIPSDGPVDPENFSAETGGDEWSAETSEYYGTSSGKY